MAQRCSGAVAPWPEPQAGAALPLAFVTVAARDATPAVGPQPGRLRPSSQAAGGGDQGCSPSQHQANSDAEREAQDPDALIVAATRCQAFGAAVRTQADALGQNLPGGAISSAVEHLPYKEIVTGSIPVSPILSSPA